ncbi:MAG TPA: branched-chain amino acid ABC transporter permease [Ilumatobacteraceae bacterium]|nr:branched-chain amino acid ABC transporter permease [Ilumatobacteraceae bacterium]
MSDLIQYVINGLATGAVYSLVALGLVVIYRGTGHLNFAQGEMALFATFVAWWLYDQGLTMWFAAIVAALLSFVIGAVIEVGLMRPAGHKSPLAVVVVAIALFQGLNSLTTLTFKGSADGLPFESLFPRKPTDFWRISDGIIWRYQHIGMLVTMLVLTGLLFLLFQKTKIGLAMRMVANNPESARLVGVNTNRMLMFSWGLSSALGAIAGVLIGGFNTNITPATMFEIFLLASAAATLGGLDSPLGALVGGLSLGVIKSLVSSYPNDWPGGGYIGGPTAIAVAFVIILIVLVIKPSGLFGSSRVERV